MARIRTIKPEYWQDEKLAPLAPIHRLVFLGLISMSDDFGRLLDNVKVVDAFVFPNTDDSAADSLTMLESLGRIRRGTTASGQSVIQILNWSRHQRVDKPNKAAALPAIAGETGIPEAVAMESRTVREQNPTDSRPIPTTNDRRTTTNDHSTASAVVGDVLANDTPDNGKAGQTDFVFPMQSGSFRLDQKRLGEYLVAYSFDVAAELRKAAVWLRDNKLRRPRGQTGMRQFLTRWLNRTADARPLTKNGRADLTAQFDALRE